jgi:hypothetical protein
MKRKLLYSLTSLALLLAVAQREALAQDDGGPDVDEHPFEVGAQLTFIGINFPERVVSGPPGSIASTVLPRDHISFPPIGTFAGSSVFTRRETTHNFQMSFGFGFGF